MNWTEEKTAEDKVNEIMREQTAYMKVEPQLISVDFAAQALREMSKGAYPMHQQRRGRAIIIGNYLFKGVKDLAGVKCDIENLKRVFSLLKFQPVVWENLTEEALRARLQEEMKRDDHREADAFALVVSSHGNEGFIATSDDRPFYIKELMDAFDGKNCPALVGKPKIFIIDTCQGGKITEGVEKPGDVSKSVGLILRGNQEKYHEESDKTIFYATCTGCKAFDSQKGSRFIRTLTYVLSRNAHTADWHKMATEVKGIMKFMDADGNLVAPHDDNYLTQTLYLLPRYKMTIYIVNKSNSESTEMLINDDAVVATVLELISQMKSEHVDKLKIVFRGNPLVDRNKALYDYGVRHGDSIYLTVESNCSLF